MNNSNTQIAMMADKMESDGGDGIGPAPAPIGWNSNAVLFVFALVFRMIYVIQSTDNPLFGVPVVDAYDYVKWANKMVDGIWLWDSVGNYLPIYPAFLAAQQIVFGPNPMVNKIIQSLMGAGTAVLLAQVAARAWNRRVGLISGYLVATYWMLAIYASEKFAETFSIFFLSLMLWLLTRCRYRGWALAAAGVAFALAAGVRANLFLVLPCVLFWLVRLNRCQRRPAFKSALLFACGTVFIIGPILANFSMVPCQKMISGFRWAIRRTGKCPPHMLSA